MCRSSEAIPSRVQTVHAWAAGQTQEGGWPWWPRLQGASPMPVLRGEVPRYGDFVLSFEKQSFLVSHLWSGRESRLLCQLPWAADALQAVPLSLLWGALSLRKIHDRFQDQTRLPSKNVIDKIILFDARDIKYSFSLLLIYIATNTTHCVCVCVRV